MKERIPILCKFKNKLVEKHILWRSPSASVKCEYGFHYQTCKCNNCSKRISLMELFKI